MSLQRITASFECDVCGTEFRVILDPATEVNGASLADSADNEKVVEREDYEAFIRGERR